MSTQTHYTCVPPPPGQCPFVMLPEGIFPATVVDCAATPMDGMMVVLLAVTVVLIVVLAFMLGRSGRPK